MHGNKSLKRRIVSGVSGQAFARIVGAVYTVVLVPLLIGSWGVSGYGEWLSIVALASYGSYSTFGLVTTGGNEVIMAAGSGAMERAKLAYQMATNLSFYLSLPILVVASISAWFFPFDRLFIMTQLSNSQAASVFTLALAQIWFYTLRGTSASTLCAEGRYALVFATEGAMRILELIVIVIVLLVFSGTQVEVALVSCVVAVLDLLLITHFRRLSYDWARIDLRVWNTGWIRSLVRPSLGFWLSNLTLQSFMLQGPRVALGAILGGQAVAVYSVYATLIRLIDQIVLVFAAPLQIEVAQSSERGDFSQAYRLVALATQVAWIMFVLTAFGLIILGPFTFHLWTANRISFDYLLMVTFLAMSACGQLGRICSYVLVSANRMFEPAQRMLLVALASLGLGCALTPAIGLMGMLVGGIVGEFCLSAIAAQALTRWLGRDTRSYVRDLLDFNGLKSVALQIASRTPMRPR